VKVPAAWIAADVDDARLLWKIKLTWHALGVPLVRKFPALFPTSGLRSDSRQKAMARDPLYAAKVAGAGKVSQHVLGEAGDLDGPRAALVEAFRWAHANLPWWQLIVYFKVPEPPTGLGESLHVSILSESPTVAQKALYYVNGSANTYLGRFDGVEGPVAV